MIKSLTAFLKVAEDRGRQAVERGVRNERGNLNIAIAALMGGLLVFVLGLILSGITIDTAATTGSNANIGSFTGVRSINDLVPLVFVFALVLIGLGLMVGGAAGLAGRGPFQN